MPARDDQPVKDATFTESTDAPEQEETTALVPVVQWTALAELPRPADAERPIHYLARIMEMLPPATGDVVDRILDSILAAPTQMEENKVWDSTGSKDAVGKRYIFHSVHIQPSDYDDGPLPYFIVADVTDATTGEQTVLTSGSVNIVTSLVKAQLLGNLPWEGEIKGPRRPTKTGHVPLHIMWIGKVVGPK